MIAFPSIDEAKRDINATALGGDLQLPQLIHKLEGGTHAPLPVAVVELLNLLLPDVIAAVQLGAKSLSASKDKAAVDAAKSLKHQRNLVLEGVAGIGKTYLIDQIAAHLRYLYGNDKQFASVVARIEQLKATLLAAITEKTRKNLDALGRDMSTELEASDLVRSITELMKDMQACVDDRCQGSVTVLVMHPSATYEEILIGLRPSPAGDRTKFVWKAGQLLHAIRAGTKAWLGDGACGPHLVVLDEINRCNLPAVLGELMLIVDPARRVTEKSFKEMDNFGGTRDVQRCIERGLGVRMPHLTELDQEKYSLLVEPIRDLLWIPENVYILGTMNSSDRSILGFDQALRRRFPPHRIEPLPFRNLIDALNLYSPFPEYIVWVNAIWGWAALNAFLRFAIGPDAMIGHSYWFNAREQTFLGASPQEAVSDAWRFGILPQAIHSAESARQERMLADMFAKGNRNAEWFPDRKSLTSDKSRKDRWDEAREVCGPFDDNPELMRDHIRSLGFAVTLLGENHGEKLIIR